MTRAVRADWARVSLLVDRFSSQVESLVRAAGVYRAGSLEPRLTEVGEQVKSRVEQFVEAHRGVLGAAVEASCAAVEKDWLSLETHPVVVLLHRQSLLAGMQAAVEHSLMDPDATGDRLI